MKKLKSISELKTSPLITRKTLKRQQKIPVPVVTKTKKSFNGSSACISTPKSLLSYGLKIQSLVNLTKTLKPC